MFPSDDWLLLLNFYLIVNSGGVLTTDNFSDERLAQVYRANPSDRYQDMDPTALKLVLEFQGQTQDTGSQNDSPLGETQEISNGLISIPLPGLPGYV
jgi:hypothetical protein